MKEVIKPGGAILLSAVTAAVDGETFINYADSYTFQATGKTSAGVGAASVNIQVSNDQLAWMNLGTIALTLGTAYVTDGFAAYGRWKHIRASLASISGTDATVTVSMGA